MKLTDFEKVCENSDKSLICNLHYELFDRNFALKMVPREWELEVLLTDCHNQEKSKADKAICYIEKIRRLEQKFSSKLEKVTKTQFYKLFDT